MNPMIQLARWFSRRELLTFGLLLAGMILLFWWRVWVPAAADRMHFSDDILIKDYATRLGLFRILLSGVIPFWDPYQFGGWPGLANCEAGFFYPFNWLLIPFVHEPQTAYGVTQWLVLLHFWIAGMGVYRCARWWGLSVWAAGFAAVAFTFCGCHCAHKKHTNMLFALVWFPWILLVLEQWVRRASVRRLFALAGLLVLAYLAGHPQSALYMTLIVFARMLQTSVEASWQVDRFDVRALVARLLPGGLALLLAFGLTAFQWLPTIELIEQGERSDADQYVASSEFSMPPHELLDIVLPEAFLQWSQVEVFYWGIAPLLLAILALVRGRFRSFEYFLLGLLATSVLFALGEFVFAYDLSYLLVPGVAWVRAPSRWIYFAGIPIALFAGRALDWIVSQDAARLDSESLLRYRRVLTGLGAILFVLVTIALFVVAGEGWRQAALASQGMAPMGYQGDELRRLFQAVLFSLLFGGIFFLFFYLTQEGKCRPVVFAILVSLLTWFDLGTHYRLLDLKPGVGGYEIDETVETLHEANWNQRTKVFLGAGGIRDRYHGAAQGFRELDGNSPLTPRLNLHLREDSAMLQPDKPNLALLDQLGVNALILDYPFRPLEFDRITQTLILRDQAAVRARILYDRFACAAYVQRDLMTLQGFPFEQVALVEQDAVPDLPPMQSPFFPKPFLLASASGDAVQLGAYLIVDGENVFDHLGREPGYYFAVGNPTTGQIERTAMFNLMASGNDPERPGHQRLRRFLQSVPEGYTVFAAIRDNAANVLFPEGVAALRSIGASMDVRSGFRFAHALVGRKGGPIGSAIEIVSPTEAIVVQTRKALYTSGSVAPLPEPEWITTAEQPNSWYHLLSDLHDRDLTEGRFFVHDTLNAATDVPPFVVPMAVYSSIQVQEFEGSFSRGKAGILIAGDDVSLNGKGYNLVRYNPATGEVVARDYFDLVRDFDINRPETGYVSDPPVENRRMQEFIQDTPDGMYVLGALKEEGIDMLLPETIAVLQAEGSRMVRYDDPDMRKSLSHAFLFMKGSGLCVESFQSGLDSLVFTRWIGGPSLTRSDLPQSIQAGIPETPIWTYPANPLDEVIEAAYTPPWANVTPLMDVWAVEEASPNQLQSSGTSLEDGLLMVNEILYPGWSAYLNGRRTPIHRVNYYFRGIEVTEGPHRVEMNYLPFPFVAGSLISLVSLGLLLNGLLFARWLDRRLGVETD